MLFVRKIYFLLVLLLAVIFIFFSSTLNYYFISDDFFYTSFKTFSDTLSFQKGEYHYNPVFWSFLWGIKQLFGLNPFVFHLATIFLHLVNIVLVFYLSKKLTKNNNLSLISAIVFAVFFSHYEVVFWITGISTSLMTLFYLLGLIFFINFTNKQTIFNYLAFFILFLLALFTHEYAISLLLVALTYWMLLGKRNKKFSYLLKLSLLPLITIISLTLAKVSFSQASLVVGVPTISRFIASIIKSFLYLFIPIPYLIDSLPKIVLPLLFLFLIVFLLLNIRKNKLRLFLFIWTFLTVIIFSLTSLPQARYFYLSSIPTILLLVSIFQTKSKLSFPGTIYLIIVLMSSLFFIQEQKQYWQKSSQITKRVLSDIKKSYPIPDQNKNIYFVNLPDSVNGPPWNAYVFRRGLEEALENQYGVRLQVVYLITAALDEKVREDEFICEKNLQELKNKGVIFIYNSDLDTVDKLNDF